MGPTMTVTVTVTTPTTILVINTIASFIVSTTIISITILHNGHHTLGKSRFRAVPRYVSETAEIKVTTSAGGTRDSTLKSQLPARIHLSLELGHFAHEKHSHEDLKLFSKGAALPPRT